MPQLPALQLDPRNALLDLSPVNNALVGIQRQQNANREYAVQQDELAMRKRTHDLQAQNMQRQWKQQDVENMGKRAMAIDNLPDGPQRQAAWQSMVQHHGADGLSPEELDYRTGPKLMAAQAGLYKDPMDAERNRLDLDYKRAQIAQLNRKTGSEGTGQVKEVGGNLVRIMPDGTVQEVYKGKPSFTPGETALDKAYAKTYEGDIASGGLSDMEKNISAIKSVQRELTAGNKNLTGPILGRLPDAVTSFTNPDAINMRDRVEEVVQRNLRVILGAQFTNEEGKRLIARAYNPALSEEKNSERLGALVSAMDQALASKKEAARYFEANGTLKGFKGKTDFSFSDFDNVLDGQPSSQNGNSRENHNPRGAPTATAAPKSAEDYNALPSGTRYTAPDGRVRIKQ